MHTVATMLYVYDVQVKSDKYKLDYFMVKNHEYHFYGDSTQVHIRTVL